jgi:hypothetical protein
MSVINLTANYLSQRRTTNRVKAGLHKPWLGLVGQVSKNVTCSVGKTMGL